MDPSGRSVLLAAMLLCCSSRALAAPDGPAAAPGSARDGASVEVQIGDVLRDAPLDGLNGPARRLADYRGRPLVINVWASWCGPCQSEMASLERLAWLDPAGRFVVIGISTDDHRDAALAMLTRSNATISQFIDANMQLEHLLGADRLPLTVLVAADGRVLDKIYGARQWDEPQSLRLISREFGIRVGPAARGR
jgi:thiol-disulfide isomerase/thioredoxin